MSKTATINMRIEPTIKAQAETVFSSFGISVTDTWQRIHFASAAKSRADTFSRRLCITYVHSQTAAHMTRAI